MDQAESILDQLLKFTAQLAEFENDPQVDAKALSNACIRRLEDLKQLMPQQRGNSRAASSEVLERCGTFIPARKFALRFWKGKTTGWPPSFKVCPRPSGPSALTTPGGIAIGE